MGLILLHQRSSRGVADQGQNVSKRRRKLFQFEVCVHKILIVDDDKRRAIGCEPTCPKATRSSTRKTRNKLWGWLRNQAGCDSFGPHDAEVLRIRTMPELSLPELHVYDSSPCYHGRDGAKFEQSIPLLSATLKLWARTGPTTRYRSRLVTGSRFQAIGLGAMFMRDAISPIEVVGYVTFPQEPVQS